MNFSQKFYFIQEEDEDEDDMLLLNFAGKRNVIDDIFKTRRNEGAFEILIKRHLFRNDRKFREYFRLSLSLFETVLNYIKSDIDKEPYRNRKAISPEEKLCITLRFMATGESLRSLAFQFRISHSWISAIIREVLTSICKRMLKDFIPSPTKDHLKLVAEDYFKLWGFPNCCGAIDGKHVRIKCPKNSGSSFYNYKDYFSIVLLAITDAHYRFIAIDVGSYGREGDAGIFAKSNFGKLIANDKFPFPAPAKIPGTSITLDHVLIGDEAFPLSKTMMKPYPQNQSSCDITKSTYNYRHSRGRRTSEDTFGMTAQYFRIFYTPISLAPEVIDKLITAACILHNMMRNSKIPFPGEKIFNKTRPKLPIRNFQKLATTNHRSTNYSSKKAREIFKMYFNSKKCSLPWQKEYIKRLK